MLYSVLIYAADGVFDRLPEAEQEAYMQTHRDLQAELAKRGRFATAQLMPVSNAVTLRATGQAGETPLVVDGPFAETKERFMGFYVFEADTLDDAIALGRRISAPDSMIEVRPVAWAGGLLET